MNEIIRHIEYLLVVNDCVVVPGLGAILAHDVPAHFASGSATLLPPSRIFTFNAGLTHNDGLLVNSLAKAKQITYEAALTLLTRECEDMRHRLHSEGSLSLGMVGKLTVDAGGALSFIPKPMVTLSPQVMWLQSIELREISSLARETSGKQVHRARILQFTRRAGRVAAGIAALIGLGLLFTTPIEVGNAQFASLGSEVAQIKTSTATDTDNSGLVRRPGELKSDLILVLNRFDDAKELADTAAHNAYVRLHAAGDNSQSLRCEASDNYCLVIGSHATEAQARKFIESANLQSYGILIRDGRYRVYAATGSTAQQLQEAARQFADNYPDAWVCRL